MWNILTNLIVFWLSSASFIIISVLVLFGLSFTYDVSSWAWGGEDDRERSRSVSVNNSDNGASCSTSKKGAKWKKSSKKKANNRATETDDGANSAVSSVYTRTISAPLNLCRNASKTELCSLCTTTATTSGRSRSTSYSDIDVSFANSHWNKGSDTYDLQKALTSDSGTSPVLSVVATNMYQFRSPSGHVNTTACGRDFNPMEENAMCSSQYVKYVTDNRSVRTIHRSKARSSGGVDGTTPASEVTMRPFSESNLDPIAGENSDAKTTTIAIPGTAAVVLVYAGTPDNPPLALQKPVVVATAGELVTSNCGPLVYGAVPPPTAQNISVTTAEAANAIPGVFSSCFDVETLKTVETTVDPTVIACPNTTSDALDPSPRNVCPILTSDVITTTKKSSCVPDEAATLKEACVRIVPNMPEAPPTSKPKAPIGSSIRNDERFVPVVTTKAKLKRRSPGVSSNLQMVSDTQVMSSNDTEKEHCNESETRGPTRSIKLRASFKRFYPKSLLDHVLQSTTSIEESNTADEVRKKWSTASDESTEGLKTNVRSPMRLSSLFPISLSTLIERSKYLPDASSQNIPSTQDRSTSISIHNVLTPPANTKVPIVCREQRGSKGSDATVRDIPLKEVRTTWTAYPILGKKTDLNKASIPKISSLISPMISDRSIASNNLITFKTSAGSDYPGSSHTSTTAAAESSTEFVRVIMSAVGNRMSSPGTVENAAKGLTSLAGAFMSSDGGPPAVTVDALGDLGVDIATARSSQDDLPAHDATGDTAPL